MSRRCGSRRQNESLRKTMPSLRIYLIVYFLTPRLTRCWEWRTPRKLLCASLRGVFLFQKSNFNSILWVWHSTRLIGTRTDARIDDFILEIRKLFSCMPAPLILKAMSDGEFHYRQRPTYLYVKIVRLEAKHIWPTIEYCRNFPLLRFSVCWIILSHLFCFLQVVLVLYTAARTDLKVALLHLQIIPNDTHQISIVSCTRSLVIQMKLLF